MTSNVYILITNSIRISLNDPFLSIFSLYRRSVASRITRGSFGFLFDPIANVKKTDVSPLVLLLVFDELVTVSHYQVANCRYFLSRPTNQTRNHHIKVTTNSTFVLFFFKNVIDIDFFSLHRRNLLADSIRKTYEIPDDQCCASCVLCFERRKEQVDDSV